MRKFRAIIKPGEQLLILLLKPYSSIASLPPIPSLYSEAVDQLLSILSRPNWQKHPSLIKLLPSLTPSHVSSLFAFNLDPQTALTFFNLIAKRPGFKHNVHSYSAMLSILIRARSLGVAENIRISMIKSCISTEDALFVLDVFREMNADGDFKFEPTLRCYNTLLMTFSRFVLIDEMKNVYLDLLSKKIQPNIYTFNTMVNGYCKIGNVIEAKLYLSRIVQAG